MGGSRLRRLAVSAAVALATLTFQLPFFDRWFSAMDEGHVLLFSEIVARGGVLYRDATLYPLPGAFYLLAALFRLFEPTMLVARWAVVVEFALFTAVAHDLVRRALPPRVAVLVVPLLWAYRVWCFPHWQMYSYSTTALLVFALSLRALVAQFESGRRAPLLAAGLLYGLGVFCKQDYGAAMGLATLATLAVATHTRDAASGAPGFASSLALFVAPAVAVGLAAALLFAHQGVLGDVLRFCVANHFRGMAGFEYWSYPSLFPLFRQDPALRAGGGLASHFPSLVWMLDYEAVRGSWLYRETPLYELVIRAMIYGPWLLCAIGALRLVRTRARFRDPARRQGALVETALLACGTSYTLLVHWVRPQDYVHGTVVTWPLVCLSLVYAAALWQTRRPLARAAVALASLVALAGLGYTGHLIGKLRAENSAPIPLARAAGISVKPGEASMLVELVETVQSAVRPDQSVGVFPYFPLLHFLADRRGPHRAGYIVWPFPEIPDRDRAIVDAMEAQQTPLVVYHFTQFLTLPRMEVYAPELYAYLVEHFDSFRTFHADRFGYKLAALRREPPPVGRALLANLAGAALFVERGGARREVAPGARAEARPRTDAPSCRCRCAPRPVSICAPPSASTPTSGSGSRPAPSSSASTSSPTTRARRSTTAASTRSARSRTAAGSSSICRSTPTPAATPRSSSRRPPRRPPARRCCPPASPCRGSFRTTPASARRHADSRSHHPRARAPRRARRRARAAVDSGSGRSARTSRASRDPGNSCATRWSRPTC